MIHQAEFSFTKLGLNRFISHLDLMRLFGRALRRAELPFAVSEGFSKHPKIVIKRALKLGRTSENEEAKIALSEYIKTDEFKEKFQKQLPEGIIIKV